MLNDSIPVVVHVRVQVMMADGHREAGGELVVGGVVDGRHVNDSWKPLSVNFAALGVKGMILYVLLVLPKAGIREPAF